VVVVSKDIRFGGRTYAPGFRALSCRKAMPSYCPVSMFCCSTLGSTLTISGSMQSMTTVKSLATTRPVIPTMRTKASFLVATTISLEEPA
jgi:hypothetical protein